MLATGAFAASALTIVDARTTAMLMPDFMPRILRERGIKTAIVLNTADHAAFIGLDVVVPVDGMSAEATSREQYVAWHLVNAPALRRRRR